MPVLLCAGKYDGIAPLGNMRAMAQRVASSELRAYEGGHLFLIQDRTAYPDIVAWLRN
jgi:3-oxoadipate enol-lactonase